VYLTLSYSISGYSFSGVEINVLECGEDVADLIRRLSSKYLLIDDSYFFAQSKELVAGRVSDEFILEHWEPK
jgi:hypothetical protein